MITLVKGPMFAGKTLRLLAEANYRFNNSKKVLAFKPLIDNRYGDDVIVCHDGRSIPAKPIEKVTDMLEHMEGDYDVALIDEIQFFDKQLIKVLPVLNEKMPVFCAGLNFDYTRKPFKVTEKVEEIADHVVELYSPCKVCREPSLYTKRLVNDEATFLLGNDNIYQVRCLKHWEN